VIYDIQYRDLTLFVVQFNRAPSRQATQWTEASTAVRIKLPRKAAFFVVTAAEAFSLAGNGSAENQSRNLWLLATQLYTKKRNSLDQGGDYGWATLRATTLNALSMHGVNTVALQAAEDLLSLLCEISPKLPRAIQGRARSIASAAPEQKPTGQPGYVAKKASASDRPSEVAEAAATSASTFARQFRDSLNTMTAHSSILATESKWADGAAIRPISVPLDHPSTMGCVWQTIDFNRAQVAQTACIDRIAKLRRALPMTSTTYEAAAQGVDALGTLPLCLSSALEIQTEPDLELERIKRAKKGDESQGAMATFYNPFDKKSSKMKIAIVAEGEERAMSLLLTNRLAVPLSVQRCQLEFKNVASERIKATPIAFTLPPKATGFAVRFPFSVHPSAKNGDGTIFTVKGISMSTL